MIAKLGDTITKLMDLTFRNSRMKGFTAAFWKDAEFQNLDQKLLLIVAEIVEAQEVIRDGKAPTEVWFDGEKPEGFGVEMADAVIRIFDTCEALGVDLEALIVEKMAFNATRPVKHGRRF